MPFIATCTYCRASKFRVPFKKRGTFATCPKCEREFLLTPETGVDLPLMKYNDLPFDDPDEDDDREGSSELVETVPEHDPVPEAAAPPEPSIEKVTVVVAPSAARRSGDLPLRFALVAFVLFGLGILATQFPYGRLVAVPFVLVGLALAAMGWLGLECYRWLGIAGMGLNGLAILLLLVLPEWLGLGGWTPHSDLETDPKSALSVGRDGSPARPAEWVDAAKAVWEFGDVRVAVSGATVGPADPAAKTAEKKKERALRITLNMTNLGVARPIEFAGWHSPPAFEAKLTAAGAPVPVRTTATEKSFVFPGKSLETAIVFAVPEKLDDLRLELPAAAIGGSEPVRFQIPKAMIFGR